MTDDIRRNMALFPIGIVMKLTDLSARQIRYYEQNGLISPIRTDGNQRLFSFNDVDRLLEIKSLIERGVNIAGIKEVLDKKKDLSSVVNKDTEKKRKDLSEQELHEILKRQLLQRRPGDVTLIQGELSRFFH